MLKILLIITILLLGTSIATCAAFNSTEETVELQIVAVTTPTTEVAGI